MEPVTNKQNNISKIEIKIESRVFCKLRLSVGVRHISVYKDSEMSEIDSGLSLKHITQQSTPLIQFLKMYF